MGQKHKPPTGKYTHGCRLVPNPDHLKPGEVCLGCEECFILVDPDGNRVNLPGRPLPSASW